MGTFSGSSELERKTLPLSQPLLDLFWDLAEMDEEKQLQATVKLVSSLQSECNVKEEDELIKTEDGDCPQSLCYTLSRLIRGLASNRGGVRWGFGTALTVLLQEFPSIKTSKVLLDTEQFLKITGPQDLKTVAVGQLTVYMTLVNSDRVATMSGNNLRKVVENLLVLEKEKSYLRAGAHEILTQMMGKVTAEAFQHTLVPLLREHLTKPFAEMDLDGLFLVLRAFQSHKKAMAPLLKKSLGTEDLLHPKNVPELCRLLYQTNAFHVHRAVFEVATAFASNPETFPVFWKQFTDLATTETPWKAKLAFDVLTHLLPDISSDSTLPALLVPTFLMFLLRNATEPRTADSESLKALHAGASRAWKEIMGKLKTVTDEEVLLAILRGLVELEKVPDEVPKLWSGFVTGVMHRLTIGNTVKVLLWMLTPLRKEGREKQGTTFYVVVVRVVGTLLHDKVKTMEDVEALRPAIEFLAQEGFTRPVSDGVQEKDSAWKELLKFVASSATDQKVLRSPAMFTADVERIVAVNKAVFHILAAACPANESITKTEFKSKALKIWKKASKLDVNPAFKNAIELICLSAAGIWIHYRPVLAEEMISEMSSIVKKVHKVGKTVSEEELVALFMHFLVSMLSVERNVFAICELVFKNLCPVMTTEAMELLLEVLRPPVMDEGGEGVEFESSDDEAGDEAMSDIEEDDEPEDPGNLELEKAALKQIPGTVDMSKESDEESDPEMDDAAMFQLDEVFAGIMRARRAEKSKSSDEIEPRIRALRLCAVFLNCPQADPLIILQILLPVMQVINEKSAGSQRQQRNQIVSTCGKILASAKHQRKLDADQLAKRTTCEEVRKVLEELVEETGKVNSLILHQQCVEGACFAQRLLLVFLQNMKRRDVAILVRKIYTPILKKFASKRNATFCANLINVLMIGLGDYSMPLLPDIIEIMFSTETVTSGDEAAPKISPKYLLFHQSQLCGIAENIIKGRTRELLQSDEIKGFLIAFGKKFTAMLKSLAATDEKVLRQKKLLESCVDFARSTMTWHAKLKKKGVDVEPLSVFWEMDETEKAAGELIQKKLLGKESRVARKMVTSLQHALNGTVAEKMDVIDGKETETEDEGIKRGKKRARKENGVRE